MTINPAALAAIKNIKLKDPEGKLIPGSENIGRDLHKALTSIQNQSTTTEQQSNTNPTGQPTAPPAINGFHVSTGPGGEFQLAITDNGEISRGVKYWADHDTSPAFSNPHAIDIGQTRNHSVFLGNQTLYWRAYSSYGTSPASAHVYHGSSVQPIPVTGGVAGSRAPSMGSGTGAQGQGGVGPGPVPKRTANSGFDWKAQQKTRK